jgi:aconitate hydratase
MKSGNEIALQMDHTLTQDATGTLAMLELEALDVDRAKTECSVQYVDHNLLQEDHKNPDDHLFLHSAARRFGLWFSRPGNGVSHPIHQERFGKPGKTLVGSDSHTPAAGAIGMFALGAGGLEVALAIAGQPVMLRMPTIWGIRLKGKLPAWVSAKDVILEMLRRHDVDGAVNCVLEYYGPGLSSLSAMDRHVIANMGTELGATTTVFPSDEEVRRFLAGQQREEDWVALEADSETDFDRHEEVDLSQLVPLIAMPSSPGNVRPVSEVSGEEIYQAYIGSSANPGYRDFAVVAEIVKNGKLPDHVSLDINPSSRQILENLVRDGHLLHLIEVGARIHQAGCNGCIGMGQAPATDKISLRTVPRNFPGRSGTREDKVCLVSPETAAASALRGVITDPRDLAIEYPRVADPPAPKIRTGLLIAPPDGDKRPPLRKGPNIISLPHFEGLPDTLEIPVLLKVGDDLSTDEIMPAGSRVLPYRSNIPKISQFVFEAIDSDYFARASKLGAHAIVAGENYGQGSSREHAALAPRYLGLRVVIAKSFARIHWQNLVNWGVLPLVVEDASDYEEIAAEDRLLLDGLGALQEKSKLLLRNLSQEKGVSVSHDLSERQVEVVRAGSLINWVKKHG